MELSLVQNDSISGTWRFSVLPKLRLQSALEEKGIAGREYEGVGRETKGICSPPSLILP
jgi:hypothetical protein